MKQTAENVHRIVECGKIVALFSSRQTEPPPAEENISKA